MPVTQFAKDALSSNRSTGTPDFGNWRKSCLELCDNDRVENCAGREAAAWEWLQNQVRVLTYWQETLVDNCESSGLLDAMTSHREFLLHCLNNRHSDGFVGKQG